MEYIIEYKNALESHECDNIISLFEKSKEQHFEGYISKNVINYNKKICTEMNVPYELEKKLNFNLEKFFLKYLEKVMYLNNLELYNEKWRIKKYKKNQGFFDWHVDNIPVFKSRLLAVIFYLNHIDEGGETLFKLDGNIKSVKPEKGKLVIFPANFCYIHKGNIPISDDKYILVTFLRIKDID